jgi:hypothetical protein
MKTILSAITGVAASASALDERTWQDQIFSTGQGR